MEASALRHPARLPVLAGLSPHLRLQSDDRLVALVRRGHDGAFEALVRRYQPRLLAFCRHMLGSAEDAEDALQEVLASAYAAIRADERSIAVRPWLYRIARNRCLNYLRRPRAATGEALEKVEPALGPAAADTVHRREELRALVADVRDLPEKQRTALLLKQVDALSYEQIAEAMETTVSSVKSLLVRARISLAEASEARRLTCAEVRLELGQAAEGVARASAPARRHSRECVRCRTFKRELRRTSRALGAALPAGPLVSIQQLLAGKLGSGSAAGAAASGVGGAGGGAGALGAGAASVAAKATAGLLAAGAVTVGAVEVRDGARSEPANGGSGAQVAVAGPGGADAGSPAGPTGEGHDARRTHGRARHRDGARRSTNRMAAHQPARAQRGTRAGAASPGARHGLDASSAHLPPPATAGGSDDTGTPTTTAGDPNQPAGDASEPPPPGGSSGDDSTAEQPADGQAPPERPAGEGEGPEAGNGP